MPLLIVSYFFANFRKPRSLAGAVAGLGHNVQALVYNRQQKRLISLNAVSSRAVNLKCCLNIQIFTQYNNFAIHLALCIATGAINRTPRGGISPRKSITILIIHGNHHASADWIEELALRMKRHRPSSRQVS